MSIASAGLNQSASFTPLNACVVFLKVVICSFTHFCWIRYSQEDSCWLVCGMQAASLIWVLFGGNCILTWFELLNSPLTVLSHPFLLHLNQRQRSHIASIFPTYLWKHTGTTKTPLYWLLVQMNKTVPYKFTLLKWHQSQHEIKIDCIYLIIHILGLIVRFILFLRYYIFCIQNGFNF